MPSENQPMRGAHDLLLVASVALGMIGLGAVATGVLDPAEPPRPERATTGDMASPWRTSGGSDGRQELFWSQPASESAQDARSRSADRPLSRPSNDGPEERLAPVEPAARRTYLLGSAAVAHRRVWVHEYVATPPASELTAGSWQP
ncbi:MAG: hypothetical protein H0T18_06765 [Chloroflexia bacterium]|nr:hypothetical protein [Chloroflexia bacterium]